MRRLSAPNEPDIAEAIARLKETQRRVLPDDARALGAAVIREFVQQLDGKWSAADWLYRRLGESRVDAALESAVDKFVNEFLK